MKFNRGYFQFAFQEEKDTAADAPLYYLRLLSGTQIGPDREIQTKRTAESGRASDGVSVVGQMGSGGTVVFVCQPSGLGAVLYGALGACSSSGSTPTTHTITPEQDESLPWITAWVQVDTVRMEIVNLKINTLKLVTSSADRLCVGTMDLLGAGVAAYQTAAPGVPATAEDIDDIFHWAQAADTWTLDSETVGYIHTFEHTINNNLQGIPGEDYYFYDVQEGPMDLDYAATITIIDASQYNTLVWGAASPANDAEPAAAITEGDFSATFTHTAGTPGPEVSWGIDVAESHYRNSLPKLSIDPDGKPQDLRLEARCTGTDPKITHTVKNATASYELGS